MMVSIWRESDVIRALLAWTEADMKSLDEQAAVHGLYSRGRSIRQIAALMDFSRNTVRRIVRAVRQSSPPSVIPAAGRGRLGASVGAALAAVSPASACAGAGSGAREPAPLGSGPEIAGDKRDPDGPVPSAASPPSESGHGKAQSRDLDQAPQSRSVYPRRRHKLDGLEAWLEARCVRHRGNAAVIRQELAAEHALVVSLRTVERAVKGWRDQLRREARATVRFETRPGEQLQADFGECWTRIDGERTKIHLCVLTLGFSRRIHVSVHRNQRQGAWLAGFETAFRHWGGVPDTLLIDNAKALIDSHDRHSGQVIPAPEMADFARHWGIQIRACAPHRARTKGKVENGVNYVKRNAIAGREFPSWPALEAHLVAWVREVADRRVHGTTGEPPIERFEREEKAALRPIDSHPGYRHLRQLERKVQSDAHVAVDAGFYSVPWRLIGQRVQVQVSDAHVRILHLEQEVARHAREDRPRHRSTDSAHLDGILQGIVASRWALRLESPAERHEANRDWARQMGAAWATGALDGAPPPAPTGPWCQPPTESRPDPPRPAPEPSVDALHRPLAVYQAIIDDSP